MIIQQLAHIDYLDEAIDACGKEIEARLSSDAEIVERLCTIPGIGRKTAEAILAEIGTDMTRFPSHKHLTSWAGMYPGNNESGGKRLSGKTRKGNTALRETLVEAARAAVRTRNTYLEGCSSTACLPAGAARKPVIAVGHAMLVIAYHLIARGGVYKDLGNNYFDQVDRAKVSRRLIQRLENLVFAVDLKENVATQPT